MDVPRNLPPPRLLEQVSNDPSAAAFAASFEPLRQNVLRYLREAGFAFGNFQRILDFGCGVGRFLFAAREALAPDQRLFGCDVNADCAEWCRNNIDFAEVRQTPFDPPLPYAEADFDFVYALSVFTHLPFEQQFAWARELHRVLRPGGVIFFTTMGEPWLPLALTQDWAERDYATIGARGMLYTFAKSSAREFEGQREVAVIHSESAIDAVFAAFEPRLHRPVAMLAGGQSLSVRQKPRDARPILLAPAASAGTVLRASGSDTTTIRFEFAAVSGRRHWRALLSFAEPRRDADRLRLRVHQCETSGDARVTEITLPFRAFFGPRHFAPLDVEIAGTGAPLDVVFEVSWKTDYRSARDVEILLSQVRIE